MQAGRGIPKAGVSSRPTLTEAIRYRQGRGNTKLAYVSHAWVTRVLNEAFGFRWSWDVTDTVIVPDLLDPHEVIVRGRLTVTTPDGGTVVKEQFGSTDVKRFKDGGVISLGDDLKAASSDALKKAASLLGVALDLYGAADDPLPGETTGPATASTKPSVERNGQHATTNKRTVAQKAPENATSDDEFNGLPGHERSAYKPKGNGHAQSSEPARRPQWAGIDEAKRWALKQCDAAGQPVYDHSRHVDASYDKLRREALASANSPKTASEFFDLWYAHVLAKVAEANAKLASELDAAAAGDEQPRF